MRQTIAAGHSEVLGPNLNCSESGLRRSVGPKAAYDGSYEILLCFQLGSWISVSLPRASWRPTNSENVGSQFLSLRHFRIELGMPPLVADCAP